MTVVQASHALVMLLCISHSSEYNIFVLYIIGHSKECQLVICILNSFAYCSSVEDLGGVPGMPWNPPFKYIHKCLILMNSKNHTIDHTQQLVSKTNN